MASSSNTQVLNDLDQLDLLERADIKWNLNPQELYEEAIKNEEAILTDDYALRVCTGKYTGRSPNDKFFVDQPSVHNKIDWGSINQPIEEEKFNELFKNVSQYLGNQRLYVKDCFAGADEAHRLNVRVVSEAAYHGLFAHNMFIRPNKKELENHQPDFTVLAAPNFKAAPENYGLNSETFILVNIEKGIILIGGTLYSGEVKKGIFSVMNYLLPQDDVMAMHCSANLGDDGKAAIFLGLSGTGKTTLSSNPGRMLIGDDEHGWGDEGVFNIEGGCYAKTINLSKEEEPLIYATTQKPGTILENVVLDEQRKPDFTDTSLTQNTRCSYPIYFIPNAKKKSVGPHPANIIFLTCDAFGVLPPISKLNTEQAMYHFISGYTAKIPGTERGIDKPQATFSACFGAPFMPLHPTVYARLLARKIKKHKSQAWLINTGWTGGEYGHGHRIALEHTRTMLKEALSGDLNKGDFREGSVFGLQIPAQIAGVSAEILHPKEAWDDEKAYNKKAKKLAGMFEKNFRQYKDQADPNILEAGPAV